MLCGLCSGVVDEFDSYTDGWESFGKGAERSSGFRLFCCEGLCCFSCKNVKQIKNYEDYVRCPICKNKKFTEAETGSKKEIAVLRGWVGKNSAWAQVELGLRYKTGRVLPHH